jgi:hypothetical protein
MENKCQNKKSFTPKLSNDVLYFQNNSSHETYVYENTNFQSTQKSHDWEAK